MSQIFLNGFYMRFCIYNMLLPSRVCFNSQNRNISKEDKLLFVREPGSTAFWVSLYSTKPLGELTCGQCVVKGCVIVPSKKHTHGMMYKVLLRISM